MAALETRHPALLRANQTALLVVDVQEAFRPAIDRFDEMVHNCRILVEGFRTLSAPIIVSEQYPKGLGHTVSALPV